MQNSESRMIRSFFLFSFLSFFFVAACSSNMPDGSIQLGAQQTDIYLHQLSGKNVGLLINHTSVIDNKHIVDFLLEKEVNIKAIFAPEHGFRGQADAGELVNDNIDEKTGIPVISLYGNNKKPSKDQMKGLDVIIFDIQDVGVRFYTYISSMHYMMEACAENDLKMIVFDRPNPNGHIVDGPMLDMAYKSFVGMHPIPVVHGLTVGELAQMVNEERWLEGDEKCDLLVVPMKNYKHSLDYSLPVKPSPNLPNDQSIMLYPSLCFFEGTKVSIGRGTYFPFQVVGYPNEKYGDFTFTPVSIEGMAKTPKLENEVCFGLDLREHPPVDKLDLSFVIEFYNMWEEKESFFTDYFNTLAGTDLLRKQIEEGRSAKEIRASWQEGLDRYKVLRKMYLLYEE